MEEIVAAVSEVLGSGHAELRASEPMPLSLACYTSGVGPLLGWWLERGLLSASAEIAELLSLHLGEARRRASSTEEQSRNVVSALVDAGLPMVVLKGGHTAYAYFTDPATRPSSDLDVLVPPDRRAEAEDVLATSGLKCVGRSRRELSWADAGTSREPRSVWLAHGDDPWSVDLHHSLDFSASAGAALVRLERRGAVCRSGAFGYSTIEPAFSGNRCCCSTSQCTRVAASIA